MISLDKFQYEVKRNQDGSSSTCYYTRLLVQRCYNRPWLINILAFTNENGTNPHGGWIASLNSDNIGIYPTPEAAAQAIYDEIVKLAQSLMALKPEDFTNRHGKT